MGGEKNGKQRSVQPYWGEEIQCTVLLGRKHAVYSAAILLQTCYYFFLPLRNNQRNRTFIRNKTCTRKTKEINPKDLLNYYFNFFNIYYQGVPGDVFGDAWGYFFGAFGAVLEAFLWCFGKFLGGNLQY